MRYMRYVFKVGSKRIISFAKSEKQARFFLFDGGNKNIYNCPLIEETGVYPGDLVRVWSPETKQYKEFVVRY